jgi:riboflavin biosynthesis pyrimidine reductase
MRPKIICHMMSSIDGRLLVDRWTPPAAGIRPATLRGHYEAVPPRFGSDGWIVGRTTMEEMMEGKPRTVKSSGDELRLTYIADRKGRDVAVVVDPGGKVHYGQDNADGDHVIAVLGEGVSDTYLAELREDGVSYIFAGSEGNDLARALDILGADFGLKTLLLEGGGKTNGAFLKVGLIDEISLLVYPGVDGLAGVPAICEYSGREDEQPGAGQSLRHVATETLEGGMVWLRYQVEKAASV